MSALTGLIPPSADVEQKTGPKRTADVEQKTEPKTWSLGIEPKTKLIKVFKLLIIRGRIHQTTI